MVDDANEASLFLDATVVELGVVVAKDARPGAVSMNFARVAANSLPTSVRFVLLGELELAILVAEGAVLVAHVFLEAVVRRGRVTERRMALRKCARDSTTTQFERRQVARRAARVALLAVVLHDGDGRSCC